LVLTEYLTIIDNYNEKNNRIIKEGMKKFLKSLRY
jgi:hypothetical protein